MNPVEVRGVTLAYDTPQGVIEAVKDVSFSAGA